MHSVVEAGSAYSVIPAQSPLLAPHWPGMAAQLVQRNRLARLLFGEILINDERVAAKKPRPELAGSFPARLSMAIEQ